MLPEIAAEALHFLTRRDLDKACGVSKWLDALIAQCCAVYPLRPVHKVAVLPCRDSFTLKVWEKHDSVTVYSFSNMYEAVQRAASFLRHSHVEEFAVSARRQRNIV